MNPQLTASCRNSAIHRALPCFLLHLALLPTLAQATEPGGAIWGWGYSPQYGRYATPPDTLLGKTVSLATGSGHTMALNSEGRLVEWTESNPEVLSSAALAAVQGHVRGYSAGSYFSTVVTDQGRVIAWGDTTFGRIAVPDSIQGHVVAASAGWSLGLAVLDDKRLVLWGRATSTGLDQIPAGIQGHAISASAGEDINVVLLDGGRVASWGPVNTSYAPPAQVQGSTVAIAAGGDHALALTSDGKVYAWGASNRGDLAVPDSIQGKVIAIAAGNDLSAALTRDHKLVAWGSDYYQQTAVPDSIQGKVTAIAAGGDRIMAVATRTPQSIHDYEPLRLTYGAGLWPMNSFRVSSGLPVVATSSDTDVVAMSIRNGYPLCTIKKVGTALITLRQNGTRYWEPTTLVETLTVAPKKLVILADTLVKPTGTSDPVLTFRDTGLVPGDALTGSLERVPGEIPGEYVVTLGTLSAGPNYSLDFNPGLLKIGKTTSIAARPVSRNPSYAFDARVTRGFVQRRSVPSRGEARLGDDLAPDAEERLSLEFRLPGPGHLEVAIFDNLGTPAISWERDYTNAQLRRLPVTADGRTSVAIGWNLRAAGGAPVAPGPYLWRIRATLDDGRKLDTVRVFGVR